MSDSTIDFARNGYMLIEGALSPEEVRRLNEAVDRDRESSRLWITRGGGRIQNANVLLTTDAFDAIIAHPSVLPSVQELVGPDLCFEEHSVMIREPIASDPPQPAWHRDTGHWEAHPLAIRNLSLVYYLTDVDASTHCFSIVPESVEAKMRSPGDRDGDGARDLHGPAGTAILFNAGSVHDARQRRTDGERRTIHIYFGHRSLPPLSNHTIFPRRLAAGPHGHLFGRPNEVSVNVHRTFDAPGGHESTSNMSD